MITSTTNRSKMNFHMLADVKSSEETLWAVCFYNRHRISVMAKSSREAIARARELNPGHLVTKVFPR